jgi:hypothetical protein
MRSRCAAAAATKHVNRLASPVRFFESRHHNVDFTGLERKAVFSNPSKKVRAHFHSYRWY